MYPTGVKSDVFGHYFQRKWRSLLNEMKLLHCLTCLGNLILCFPMWILAWNIWERHNYLQQYFLPLAEEWKSFQNVRILSILPLFVFPIASGLQFLILHVYFKYGHPWKSLIRMELQIKDKVMEETGEELEIYHLISNDANNDSPTNFSDSATDNQENQDQNEFILEKSGQITNDDLSEENEAIIVIKETVNSLEKADSKKDISESTEESNPRVNNVEVEKESLG